jgi:DNA-directed RNA polymerase specialized sigma24 family protein
MHADPERVERAVTAVKAGDPSALHYLYVRYADDVCSYVRSIVREHGDAEHVTQSVFQSLPRTIARYESRVLPFERWLLGLARDSAVDQVMWSSRGQTAWVPPMPCEWMPASSSA